MRMLFFVTIINVLFIFSCQNERKLDYEISNECININGKNILLRGVPNILKIKNYNASSNNLEIRINNKVFKPTKDYTFTINLNELRKVNVNLVDTVKNVVLTSKVFSVKDLPLPIVKLRPVTHYSKTISKEKLLLQEGLISEVLNWDYNLIVPIERFSILDIKNDNRELESLSGDFTPIQKRFIGKMKSGEYLIIANIKAKMSYGETTQLSPVIYRIL